LEVPGTFEKVGLLPFLPYPWYNWALQSSTISPNGHKEPAGPKEPLSHKEPIKDGKGKSLRGQGDRER
jgi:hypothetical protein